MTARIIAVVFPGYYKCNPEGWTILRFADGTTGRFSGALGQASEELEIVDGRIVRRKPFVWPPNNVQIIV